MRRLEQFLMSSLLLLLAAGSASAQKKGGREFEFTVVLDDKFQDMKVPLGTGWKLASDFKQDKETRGFILYLAHAKPVAVPKTQTFVGGAKSWNDALVRYPFRLTYRPEGKGNETQVARGEIRGTASPLSVKEINVANMKYELRVVSLEELAKEAAVEVVTPGGVDNQVRLNLTALIARPDPGLIGGVLAEVRRGKNETTLVVAMKNRLPMRVAGALETQAAPNQRTEFELKPGESKNVIIPVDAARLKGKPLVSVHTLRLEPPEAK